MLPSKRDCSSGILHVSTGSLLALTRDTSVWQPRWYLRRVSVRDAIARLP